MGSHWKYQRLFTTFLAEGINKMKGSPPNRWMINEPHRMRAVADWNNIESSLVELFTEKKFLTTCMIFLSVTHYSNQIQI